MADIAARCPLCGAAASSADVPAPLPALGPDRAERTRRWIAAVDGQRLRAVRREHGLSIEKLAHQAGLSLSTVARLEHDPRPRCHVRTLGLLCAALGEPPAAITREAPGPGGTGG